MNERAIELYKQATKFAYATIGKEHADMSYFQAAVTGKFAELIIKECAAYLNGAMEVHNQSEQDLCDHAARKIKEHFGVK